MGRFKPFVAMLMLALFAFTSSHSLLEGFDLIHHEAEEHSEESDRGHDAADGLVRLESHQEEFQKVTAGAPLLSNHLALTLLAILHQGEFERPCMERANSPPPELLHTWHFSTRTALPVRAPSIAS